MLIEMTQIGRLRGRIAEKLQTTDPDTVMVPREGRVTEDTIQFLNGPEDFQEFMMTEPDARGFEAIAPKDMHSVLVDIDDGAIFPRLAINRGVPMEGLVDLGSMLEDQAIISGVELEISKIEGMLEIENAGKRLTDLREQIARDIGRLCKDEAGVALANETWSRFEHILGVSRPDFVPSRESQWYRDSRLQSVSSFGSVTVSGTYLTDEQQLFLEVDDYRGLLPVLGSHLDLSEVSELAGRTEGIIEERQFFGQRGRQDKIDIEWHLEMGRLMSYEVTLRKHLEVPDRVVAGINLRELEEDLRRFDWSRVYVDIDAENPDLASISQDLHRLCYNEEEDRLVGVLLAFKYLAYTQNEGAIPRVSEIKDVYERKLALRPADGMITLQKAYNLLDGRSIGQSVGENGWIWRAMDQDRRAADGGRLLVDVSPLSGFDPILAMKRMGAQNIDVEAIKSLQTGSKIMLQIELNGITAHRIVFADPRQGGLVIDQVEGDFYGLYRVSDEDLYRDRKARMEAGVDQLVASAELMGLNNRNLDRIGQNILMWDAPFHLRQEQIFCGERTRYRVNFDRVNSTEYNISSVSVDIRRDLAPSVPIIENIKVDDLRQSMDEIDWHRDFTSTNSIVFHLNQRGGDKAMQINVINIKGNLESLFFSRNPEGAEVAVGLGLRYLKGTPNEELVPALIRGMEMYHSARTFDRSPEFTLEAMYNLMTSRFAMGKMTGGSEVGEKRTWYYVSRASGKNGTYPLTPVPGDFSIQKALIENDLMEAKIPALREKAVWALENGSLFPVNLNRSDFSGPLYVFAQPVAKVLMVDVGVTLRERGYTKEAEDHKLTKIDLVSFAKIMERVTDLDGMFRNVNKLMGKESIVEGDRQVKKHQSNGL